MTLRRTLHVGLGAMALMMVFVGFTAYATHQQVQAVVADTGGSLDALFRRAHAIIAVATVLGLATVVGFGVYVRRAVLRPLHRLIDAVESVYGLNVDTEELESFAGEAEFGQFLVRTEILVNLLPLTDETAGILNRHTLGELPKGACLVNAARGGHLVEEDLLELLGTGQIAEATLDVFREEPLPAGHPFWDHRRITVTPHEAAITPAETAAATIAQNIRRIERGEAPSPVVDFSKGY